eukprot:TRINITY_DN1447_c0_g1_i1.p1 TRINITY_DN1447_c0_g1~~TRINITY_DN1447_c0_g1_i1.p1  ORF type:complete len:334 (+),score=67.59 TRINITY_DN1447_c0_g1_i1:456-1457(+)
MENCANEIVKDLREKRQMFARMASEAGSMVSELKDLRNRVASQETSLAQESASRQAAEARARSLEKELEELQRSLEDKNHRLKASSSVVQQYQRELQDVKSSLQHLEESAEVNEAIARCAELQSTSLLKELEEKNSLLHDYEDRILTLDQRIHELNQCLSSREDYQRNLKDEILRIEHDISFALAHATAQKDCQLRKILEEVSAKNYENLSKHLKSKDEEIAKLKEEIKAVSIQWKLKTQELEAQLEKQRRADQEIRKRVLKLEFCLHEARAQTRKVQRMAERREKTIKELREEVRAMRNPEAPSGKRGFWESSCFKIVASVSMVAVVLFCRR